MVPLTLSWEARWHRSRRVRSLSISQVTSFVTIEGSKLLCALWSPSYFLGRQDGIEVEESALCPFPRWALRLDAIRIERLYRVCFDLQLHRPAPASGPPIPKSEGREFPPLRQCSALCCTGSFPLQEPCPLPTEPLLANQHVATGHLLGPAAGQRNRLRTEHHKTLLRESFRSGRKSI